MACKAHCQTMEERSELTLVFNSSTRLHKVDSTKSEDVTSPKQTNPDSAGIGDANVVK